MPDTAIMRGAVIVCMAGFLGISEWPCLRVAVMCLWMPQHVALCRDCAARYGVLDYPPQIKEYYA